jgi:hypothetical protein
MFKRVIAALLLAAVTDSRDPYFPDGGRRFDRAGDTAKKFSNQWASESESTSGKASTLVTIRREKFHHDDWRCAFRRGMAD